MLPGFSRALTTAHMERVKVAAVQSSQAEVDMSSSDGMSMKVHWFISLVLACIIFGACFIAALFRLVYCCSPALEAIDASVPLSNSANQSRAQSGLLSASRRLEATQSTMENFMQELTHLSGTPSAALSANTVDSKVNGRVWTQRPSSVSSISTRIPASISETGHTTAINTERSVCTEALKGLEQGSEHMIAAPECSTEYSEDTSSAAIQKPRKSRFNFNMTPAQRRMIRGTNEFINSQMSCSDNSLFAHDVAQSDHYDSSEPSAYLPTKPPLYGAAGLADAGSGIKQWKTQLYTKGGASAPKPPRIPKPVNREKLQATQDSSQISNNPRSSTMSLVPIQGNTQGPSGSTLNLPSANTSDFSRRYNRTTGRLPSLLEESPSCTSQSASVLPSGSIQADSAAMHASNVIHGVNAFIPDCCPLDRIDLRPQVCFFSRTHALLVVAPTLVY